MKKFIYLLLILTIALSACKKKDNPVDEDETVDFLTNRNVVALYGFNESPNDNSKNKLHLNEYDITFTEWSVPQ